MDWEEWLRDVLCEIVKSWGRKCDFLHENCDERAAQVDDVYRTEGAPTFPEGGSVALLLTHLADLELGLGDSKNSLDQSTNDLLRRFITDLRLEFPQ
ncbi:MAG TPA: hypothetical protein VD997_10305 [Phycisphaerales bacterium]|nr:hypothetical protein [Phycisphaerales bacterium]